MIRHPLTSDYDDPSFGRRRKIAVALAMVAGAALAVVHGRVAAQQLFANEQGIAAAKVLIAVLIGAASGISLWAFVAMLTISFAPEGWLRLSPRGQLWMRRSGLRLDNTTALRVISFHIGVAAGLYTLFNIVAVVAALRN